MDQSSSEFFETYFQAKKTVVIPASNTEDIIDELETGIQEIDKSNLEEARNSMTSARNQLVRFLGN